MSAAVAYFCWRERPEFIALKELLGLLLLVVSLAVVAIARVQLGSSFSTKPKATELVTTGLYRRVRNPLYIAGVGAVFGFAGWVGSMAPLALLVVLVPVQIMRARAESNLLRQRFGERYSNWAKQCWF